MATLTSIRSLSRTFSSKDNTDNLHDVSFASYMNDTGEVFVRKLADSTRKLIPYTTAQGEHLRLAGKKEEDGEIGVFSAEKYFNGGMDQDSPKLGKVVTARKYLHKKDEQIDVAPTKPKVHPATPSERSESSWNSQRALLKSVAKNPSGKKKNKAYGISLLSGLGCKCYCSDKGSVAVDEQEQVGEISFNVVQSQAVVKEHIKMNLDVEHKSPLSGSRVQDCQNSDKLGIGLNKDNCFTFPTLNSAPGGPPVERKLSEEEEPKARTSLEVFGSPIYEKRNKSLSLERRLKMLSWDANPRMEEIETSAPAGGGYYDNESDASSDLFEIESVTGKVTTFLARQGSDTNSGCLTPTTGYAPSEASIEWSVVTASAADFSTMSDYDELRPPTGLASPIKTFPKATNAKHTIPKEIPRRRPVSLLGCKSQKAVNVKGDAHRSNEKVDCETRMHRVSDSYMTLTRFQSESKLTGLDSEHRKHTLSTKPLPRSYSPLNSQVLYIQ